MFVTNSCFGGSFCKATHICTISNSDFRISSSRQHVLAFFQTYPTIYNLFIFCSSIILIVSTVIQNNAWGQKKKKKATAEKKRRRRREENRRRRRRRGRNRRMRRRERNTIIWWGFIYLSLHQDPPHQAGIAQFIIAQLFSRVRQLSNIFHWGGQHNFPASI